LAGKAGSIFASIGWRRRAGPISIGAASVDLPLAGAMLLLAPIAGPPRRDGRGGAGPAAHLVGGDAAGGVDRARG
jgi:hypothetical protein